MRKTIATTLALSAAALTLGVPGAAHADRYAVDDPEDTHHGSDVLTMTVQHGKKNVAVTTRHLGLRKDPATGSGGTVYFDTDPSDQGPEFVFVGGYFDGTDYTLNETEGSDASSGATRCSTATTSCGSATRRTRCGSWCPARRSGTRPRSGSRSARPAPAPTAPAPGSWTGSASRASSPPGWLADAGRPG